jgi:hypothetical protein
MLQIGAEYPYFLQSFFEEVGELEQCLLPARAVSGFRE